MKKTSKIGMILLAIWLVLKGLIPLLNIHIANLDLLMAILAVATGILIFLDR
ncbi:hypothetical protein GF407_14390 [candidate division KSB1 bacterium]|nr:hypothetical protein [candidate division KSB1 bacterium]